MSRVGKPLTRSIFVASALAFGTGAVSKAATGPSTFVVNTTATLDQALIPLIGYKTTLPRTAWASGGGSITCDFDVICGPKQTFPLSDDWGVTRASPTSFPSISTTDGFVYQVTLGSYAIASGVAPLLSGRRVRGASDGTQFAIEVYAWNDGTTAKITERVYFLSTTSLGKPEIVIKIYADEKQSVEPDPSAWVHLDSPGKFFELTYPAAGGTDETRIDATYRQNNAQPAAFEDQIFHILNDASVPAEPGTCSCEDTEVALSTAGSTPQLEIVAPKNVDKPLSELQTYSVRAFRPVAMVSPTARFVKKIQKVDAKATITVSVPIGRNGAPAQIPGAPASSPTSSGAPALPKPAVSPKDPIPGR